MASVSAPMPPAIRQAPDMDAPASIRMAGWSRARSTSMAPVSYCSNASTPNAVTTRSSSGCMAGQNQVAPRSKRSAASRCASGSAATGTDMMRPPKVSRASSST
ncbi:Uncharacterised protein [Bordetella pertussis]|nr:Uncharacterised protein [Bordetella pertussis]